MRSLRIVAFLFAACLPAKGSMAEEWAPFAAATPQSGAYIAAAAGCLGCHTDHKNKGAAFAGGRALGTPFGTLYSPNITSDTAAGIGGWDFARFEEAVRHGRRADGSRYYPAFPYTSYRSISDADMERLWQYFQSVPAVSQPNRAHDLPPPFSWRWTLHVWTALFFEDTPRTESQGLNDEQLRGEYLVNALSHCGECHTPRNFMGALQEDKFLAGTAEGPEGELAPNITPDTTGLADWSIGDIVTLLKSGFKPDFDNVQGTMDEAIQDGLKYLDDADLKAIAAYLKAVPPISNRVQRSQ